MKLFCLKAFLWLIHCLPVRWAGGIGAGIGRLTYSLSRRHRRICFRNLSRIYPHQTRAWRARMARESLAELGRQMFELAHVFLWSKQRLLRHVHIEGEALLQAALKQQKGCFLLACHHSNWELGSLICSMLNPNGSAMMYRCLRDQALDDLLKNYRQRFGNQLHARQGSLRWLSKALQANQSVGIMIDQHLSNGRRVPFLGHTAYSTTLPATFARKYQTPVLGIALQRHERDFQFTLKIWDAEQGCPQTSNDIERMSHYMHGFAPIIHQRPELWLWSHCRWRILELHKAASEAVYGTP